MKPNFQRITRALNPLFLILLLCLLLVPTASAQDDVDAPGDFSIIYDQEVTETITDRAIFDWWRLDAEAGDVVYVEMIGLSGLAPLIGILSPGGDLKAASEDGAPDGTVTLEYTTEIAGPHRIIATRVGNMDGTTTGSYLLTVRRANTSASIPNPLQEVTFRCDAMEVTTAATISFGDDRGDAIAYRISVYGLDGFSPVVRINLSAPEVTDCSQDDQAMYGDEYTLPGEETRTILEADPLTSSQVTVLSAELVGTVTLTIGTRDGSPGRYLAVIEGLTVGHRQDKDTFTMRLGPLARNTEMLVYMVGAENNRLDPFMRIDSLDIEAPEISCDDAGSRTCSDVPSIVGAGVKFNDAAHIVGDRFDAGLRLAAGNPDPIFVQLGSRESNTQGGYSVLIIGEMPPQ